MLFRLSAIGLILLIVLPCSAPFPTFEVGSGFAVHTTTAVGQPEPAPHHALTDAARSMAMPLMRTATRLRHARAALTSSKTLARLAPGADREAPRPRTGAAAARPSCNPPLRI